MKQPINKEFIKNRYDTTIDNFSNPGISGKWD